MKKTLYSLLLVALINFSCNSQTNKKDEHTVNTHKEIPGNPRKDIKVNKKYDKNGDLISFDSTYSSYYSSNKSDKASMENLYKNFKPEFTKQFPILKDNNFSNLFFNDSLFYDDFFHDDFFRKRLELNNDYMQKMMTQMDSVKNEYFKRQSKTTDK